MPSVSDLEKEYLLGVIGAPGVGKTLTDLRYLYYKGVDDGTINVGADPAEIQVIVDDYFSTNPPEVSATGIMPELLADSQTTFPSTRAAFIAANFPGYVGPIRFDSAKYLDHVAPPDYQAWDRWKRRRTV